ncbi:MAG: 16S rRNA processing protein RimM [Clostridia bacterium]|nr:16S rRNA processing protein RimM [Clostridia bacterium]
MPQKYLQAGKVVGTHGIRGEMRVEVWCDSPEFLAKFKKLYTDKDGNGVLLVKSRAHGNICLVKAEGIDSIESAEKYRGKLLYIDRDDCKLPEGSYFITDIIGCVAVDFDTNEEYGMVCDVSQTGANDVWHIKRNESECLIPNVPEFVKKVDIDDGKVYITPLKGTFDDED